MDLRLLDRTGGKPGDPSLLGDLLDAAGLRRRRPRIRCPLCRWRPRRRDRWLCTHRGCGMVWNTFETHGRCPRCAYQWTVTACLACSRLSPHEAWYERGEESPPP